MANSNKLEKSQLDQINDLNEGLFSPILKKLVQGRLKKKLKSFQKDPQMRAALKKLDRSIKDFERELEIGAELLASQDPDDMGKSAKEREKTLIDLGFAPYFKKRRK
jgi:hypothetical protein|tara:strand:- start:13141 stop:13461 length:321 start_codon:yes stop_codon:yes gene_type:complete